jgi:hypothetical protein
MLNKAIEKNERFLRVCCKFADAAALLLIIFTLIQISGAIYLVWEGGHFSKYNSFAYLYIYKFIFAIILLHGISELIKYLIETDYKLHWILRFADKIIYLYTFCFFIAFVYSFIAKHIITVNWPDPTQAGNMWLMIPVITLTMLIKVILWIGAGQVVKRILPIIQESKTLV